MITTTVKHVSIVNSASRRPSEEILNNNSNRKLSTETDSQSSHLTNFTHYPINKATKEFKSPSNNFKKSSEDSIEIIDELNHLINRKKSSVSSLSKLNQPPLLPPRKQSQISNISTASESSNLPEDDLQVDDDEEFESNRLDRGRNKPLKKLSIKRSKSSKIEENSSSTFEVVKSPSETDLIKSKTNQLDQQPYSRTPPSSFDQNQADSIHSTQPIQKNAFQKAKKQIKTFIIGGGSRAERKSKENLVDNDQASDEINSSRLRKQSSETNASILGAVNQNSSSLSSSFSHAIGHNLVDYLNCSKNDICSVCEKSDLHNGIKCSDCDILFHEDCSSSAVLIPCVSKKSVEFYTNSAFSNLNQQPQTSSFGYTKNIQQASGFNPSRPPRNKYRNKPAKSTNASQAQTGSSGASKDSPYSSRSSSIGSKQQSTSSTTNKFGYNNSSSSWNVTRTSEFIDSYDVMITDVTELHYMEIFIGNKLCEMEPSKTKQTKESMIDVVFKNALKEFKCNLISTYSVASQDGRLHITYKSLIEHFEQVVSNVCQKESNCKSSASDFPVTIAVNSLVNAFRCYLDEFRNLAKFNSDEKPKYEKQNKQGVKRKRGGKKKVNREDLVEKYGHKFHAVTANIPTVCEVCQSLMWLTEKVFSKNYFVIIFHIFLTCNFIFLS